MGFDPDSGPVFSLSCRCPKPPHNNTRKTTKCGSQDGGTPSSRRLSPWPIWRRHASSIAVTCGRLPEGTTVPNVQVA